MRVAFLVIVVILLAAGIAAAQETASARDTVRRATTTGLVDYEAVRRNLERGSKKGFFRRAADFMRKPMFGRPTPSSERTAWRAWPIRRRRA